MPLYSYRSAGCCHEFELLARAPDVPACPSCDGGLLERVKSLTAPPGRPSGILGNARRAEPGAGHFSNYSKAERPKVL